MSLVEGSDRSGEWRQHVAIAALSLALVLFEVLVTRVLSVTLAYHFAFLSVSLAMLGLGAPGVWFSLRPPTVHSLPRALMASAASLPAAMLLIARVGAPMRGVTAFWVACLLVPMISLGSAVCILLLRARGERVARMYAFDLAGAALGAVLVSPLLHGLPTPSVIAALGVLPLAALALLVRSARIGGAIAGVFLAVTAVWGAPYRLTYSKYSTERRPTLYDRWTPTAHVTVHPSSDRGMYIGWGLGSRSPRRPLEHLWLDQDGSAGTQILRYVRGTPPPPDLLFDVTSAGYQFGTPSRACIVGGGGGRDILTALSAGARTVEVVELNPYIVELVSGQFGSYSGDPYHLPGVRAFVGEGRSHFTRSGSVCDVLQISLIDTFAATAAGAYALTENGLYTVEAIRTFWSRLSPTGVLSISRWCEGPGHSEAMRLVLLEVEALRGAGISDPKSHLVVLQGGATANALLFRRPVDDQTLAAIAVVEARRGFRRLWPPSAAGTPRSGVTLVLQHGPEAIEALGYDLSPTTDDRPYFFQTLDLFKGTEQIVRTGSGEREESVSLLRRLLAVVGLVTLGLFFLPLALGQRLPRGRAHRSGTVYFAAIGMGFMFVEIPLMQRLALYLGHPSYATTVVLGALLLGVGVGSSAVPRIATSRRRAAALAVPLVVAATVLPLTGWVAEATLGWSLAARVAVSAIGVFVTGVAMGLPFPMGMSHFDDRDRSWYWSINGASGVLASVLALVLSLVVGLSNVALLAIACYAVAALALPSEEQR